MKSQTKTSISFESVFGNSPEDIPLAQLDQFLDQVVQDCFKNSQQDPNELIRIVDQGKVMWMTVNQAELHIKTMDEVHQKSFENKIQESLRGNSTILSQELRILLMMAFGTIKRYKQENLIPQQELERTELTLNRLGRSVYTTLDLLRQVEMNMKDTRRKNPVINEFEKKMAQFLTWQKSGENEKAALLARDLVHLKKKYLVVSKVLNNDKNTSQTHRLDTQRHKKSILSYQKYLAAQREGILQDELNDIRENIQTIKSVLEKESGKKRNEYEKMLKIREDKQNKNQTELDVVQREQIVLDKQEKQTESMIRKMEEEVSVVHVKETPKQEEPKKPVPPPEKPAQSEEPEDTKKSVKRMVRNRTR